MQLPSRLSEARPSSKQVLMHLPSQNGSSGGLSERTGSLKSSRSFEPQRSDSASSYSQDVRNSSQKIQSIRLQSPSWVEENSSPAEDLQPSKEDDEDDEDTRRIVVDDTVSASIEKSQSSGGVSQSDGNYASDAPMLNLNIHPPIPTPIFGLDQAATQSQVFSETGQTGFAAPSTSSSNLSVSTPLVRSKSFPTHEVIIPTPLTNSTGTATTTRSNVQPVHVNGTTFPRMTDEKSVFSRHQAAPSDSSVPQPHQHLYKDDFLGRNSTLSMGSPPPYYEVVNQSHHHHHHQQHQQRQQQHAGPSTLNGHAGPIDPVAGPSRSSGEWPTNESRRDSPATRTRVRARPPFPIGPRRPSQGHVVPPSSVAFSDSFDRSGSVGSSSQPSLLSRQRSARIPIIPPPKFQTPPPKWRGHTMDAARWTFKSSQLQAIVTKAIKQSSEASLIRLLEPEILENDIPAEIADLETLRTDIKTRYKLLARRRAVLYEALSSFLAGNTEHGLGYAHRLLEELSEIATHMDHLSEELHSADNQLTYLDSLTQLHTSSALAVALRKLNTSFLKQMTENENIRNDLCSVEAERDEAWLEAERIANEMDQLAGKVAAESQSPVVSSSNRSSRVSAHRKSSAIASKAGLKVVAKRRPSQKLSLKVSPPTSTAFSSPFVSPTSSSKGGGGATRHAKPGSPPTSSSSSGQRKEPVVPNTTDSTLSPPVCFSFSFCSFFTHSLRFILFYKGTCL
jgi:hypothetical protein